MGPITLEPLYDVIVALVVFGLDYSLMYGWVMITSVVSIVKLEKGYHIICGRAWIVGDYSTHLRSTGIARIQHFSGQRVEVNMYD